MSEGIYISIKPKPMDKIVKKIKNYEFMNYIPKEKFKFLYVYVPLLECQLKYVIEVGKIVKYPEKLQECGDGNLEFNEGKKTNMPIKYLKCKN